MNRSEKISALLMAGLAPLECQIEDESALHAGHAGAASGGGHFKVKLVATCFHGLNKVARHRLVYDCVSSMMPIEIHALSLTLLTPAEIESA